MALTEGQKLVGPKGQVLTVVNGKITLPGGKLPEITDSQMLPPPPPPWPVVRSDQMPVILLPSGALWTIQTRVGMTLVSVLGNLDIDQLWQQHTPQRPVKVGAMTSREIQKQRELVPISGAKRDPMADHDAPGAYYLQSVEFLTYHEVASILGCKGCKTEAATDYQERLREMGFDRNTIADIARIKRLAQMPPKLPLPAKERRRRISYYGE